VPAFDTAAKNLFTITVNMLLLVNIRPNIVSDEAKSLQASLRRHFRAGFLQVLGSTMPMRSTKGAEVQLQMKLCGHGVGGMDFGSPKQIVVATFVSAEKLSPRKAGPYFAHAFHVKSAFDER
jgi:hypothetical protein